MSFYDNWSRDKANLEAQDFLRGGSVANKGNAFFSNIDSGRVGCADSSDCASGWRCVGGYCISPQNTPASGRNSSINDQGCGSDGTSGGGGGNCGPSTLGDSGDSGGCVKTGCGKGTTGGGSSQSDKDCCGDTRCCRFDRFGVRCVCGECPEDEECDKFCSSYRNAIAEGAPGCSSGTECDECTSCEFFSFQGPKYTYKCKPKQSAPCWCEQKENRNVCGDCEYCSERGTCYNDNNKCQPVYPPKEEEEPPVGDPCAGYCVGVSWCDGDQPEPPCPSQTTCTDNGFISAGGKTCYIRTDCDKSGAPASCGECDCNCNNDCKDCEICSSSGECVPDPACNKFFTEIAWQLNTCQVFFAWGIGFSPRCTLNSCPGSASQKAEAVLTRRGELANDRPGFSWGPVIDAGYSCNNRGCPDIEVPGSLIQRLLLNGSETDRYSFAASTTCPSTFFDSIRISYFDLGVAVGIGDTQAEADADARAQLPGIRPV